MIKKITGNSAKNILKVVFLIGLVYILLPGPSKIGDYPPLSPSVKSDLAGDTWQNPNIVAYFSNYRRDYITSFYKNEVVKKYFLGMFFPPIRLNHPPEEAYTYIRDQQESSFLEEYVYPLKGSLFVNGYEPLVINSIHKRAEIVGFVGNNINYKNNYYASKATLRFYPAHPVSRVGVYLGIWLAGWGIYRLFRKAWQES